VALPNAPDAERRNRDEDAERWACRGPSEGNSYRSGGNAGRLLPRDRTTRMPVVIVDGQEIEIGADERLNCI
jgi:hypothetical protein